MLWLDSRVAILYPRLGAMSGDPTLIQPYKVSKELQNAIEDDAKRQVCTCTVSAAGSGSADADSSQPGSTHYICWRQAIDSAKKRAVGQHVDYDTFKNMVSTVTNETDRN